MVNQQMFDVNPNVDLWSLLDGTTVGRGDSLSRGVVLKSE